MWPSTTWSNGFSQPHVLRALQRIFVLLGVNHAAAFAYKSFRSGHATEMAAEGYTLSQILEAGCWKSSAFARYIDEGEADKQQMSRLHHAMDIAEDK